MPALRIGSLPWVPISVYCSGCLHLCSQILFLTPRWFQQSVLFPARPVRCQPVSERSYPTDDQIVYQWSCRERGRRPYLSAQCDSSSRAESGGGNHGVVEPGDARGVWKPSQHFVCRNLRKLGSIPAFYLGADSIAETDPAE